MIKASFTFKIKNKTFMLNCNIPNLDNSMKTRTINVKSYIHALERNIHTLILKEIDGINEEKAKILGNHIASLSKNHFYTGQGYTKKTFQELDI